MSHFEPKGPVGRFVNTFEETAIAVLLGLMTLVTFINVVLRYGFNTGLIWGLEVTSYLFAWLVLFGISYGVKTTSHLGVDALTSLFSAPVRKAIALLAGVFCIAYAFLIAKGAWDYWAPFAGLDATSGRWFPTGFANSRDQAWYVTNDVPMPDFLRFLESSMNQGEEYEKLPRFIPYVMLPFGALLLLFRFVQATWWIAIGRSTSLIVSHEVEDDIEDAAKRAGEN